LYTEENIKLLGKDTKWITHIPATVSEAQKLLNSNLNMIPGSDPRYAFFTTALNYAGAPPRAVVVWSEEMKKRNEKTFEKKIEK
jgi:transposase